MNNLLIFFALPLATIIISIVLERIWKNYILVTLFAFAIFLIVAFSVGDANLLVLVIAYTVLAFLSAFLSMLFRRISQRIRRLEDASNVNNENCCRSNCICRNSNGTNNCNNSNNSNTQDVSINARITPNNNRTGTFRGQYRRRF